MVEVKCVKGYEGLYIIDNLGNVVSLPRQNGRFFLNQYRMLTPHKSKFGYLQVALTKNNKTKTVLLHRLIAEHFIDNPNNYPCVNHKNGLKDDNRIENLEWCTKSENTLHAFNNNLGGFRDRAIESVKAINEKAIYRKIVLIDKDGKEYVFDCTRKAAEFIGTNNDDVTRAIRKSQRVCGYKAYGEKCEYGANGET